MVGEALGSGGARFAPYNLTTSAMSPLGPFQHYGRRAAADQLGDAAEVLIAVRLGAIAIGTSNDVQRRISRAVPFCLRHQLNGTYLLDHCFGCAGV
jgi:hypothetical protein